MDSVDNIVNSFEPMSVSSSFSVIFRVRVVLKRTVVGDRQFDNMSWSRLQSQVKSVWGSSILIPWNCLVFSAKQNKRIVHVNYLPEVVRCHTLYSRGASLLPWETLLKQTRTYQQKQTARLNFISTLHLVAVYFYSCKSEMSIAKILPHLSSLLILLIYK